ncbi:hypothetical protein niasHS_007435 [Heterodera schachtii]|uniref:Transmembrane protein n=1 Tax=Heterodera schachtii TaxID=97005 RepID=A0ABD2JXJ3_HETSC
MVRFSSSNSLRSLPIFFLFFLLLPIFCGTAQKTANGAEKESEMDQHELEEGSGDLFNPDDEDDIGGSGMTPPAEETDHQIVRHPSDSATPTPSISRHHSLADTSAPTHSQQTFTVPSPSEKPRFSAIPPTEDEEEGPLREHFHMALLFSVVVLVIAVGIASVALCFCYRRRRRRTRQNHSEDYSAGREQSRHYL